MDVCVEQTLLQRVLCILVVAQQRECGAKEFGAVANEDWRKRIGISCECALNEPPFFGCRARINRLARACRYLRSEERRVGKECRSRGRGCEYRDKQEH